MTLECVTRTSRQQNLLVPVLRRRFLRSCLDNDELKLW